MASVSPHPTKLWWLLAMVLLCLSLVVQLPASWMVQKFAPKNAYLQHISGNLWQGQAYWQVMANPTKILTATTDWQWQPWQIVTGKLGFHTDIHASNTNLIGNTKFNKSSWQANDFSGKISSDTLKQLMSWQLPDTPIMVKDVSIERGAKGFTDAKGSLTWAGGELGYPSGGRVYKITMPQMVGALSVDKASGTNAQNATAGNGQRLHLAMTTPQGQRLGDIYLDSDNMVDVALTQRLLKGMPDYHGQGADDSVVVSLRQPLSSMR